MNKKILSLIFGGTVLAASVFAFAGCNNGHKHNYEIFYQLADCNTEGYTLHTCKDCGYKYADDFVEPLGHAYGEYYHVHGDSTETVASYALAGERAHEGHNVFTTFTEQQIAEYEGRNVMSCALVECPICEKANGQEALLDIYFYELMMRMAASTMTQSSPYRYSFNLPGIEERDGRYFPKTTVTQEDMQLLHNVNPFSALGGNGNAKMNVIDMIIPDSVTEIKDFAGPENLNCVGRVHLSENLESIGKNTFNSLSVQSLVIPESLKRIEDMAFSKCEKMKVVYYKGTQEMWNAIKIGEGNEDLKNALRYYYSANKPTNAGNYWHYVDGEPTIWK